MKKKTGIKKIPIKDYDAFVDIVADAYPGMKIITPEEKEKTVKQLKESAKYPTMDYYGLYRKSKLIGVMALYDFTINLFSTKAKIGGIGLVAVDLLHKKEKVCKEMVSYFLELYWKKGACMTALFPFRPDFYRKMGFGIGSKVAQYSVKPQDLGRAGMKKHIHHMTIKDKTALERCYNRFVERRHGMMSARPNKWAQVFKAPTAKIIGYKKGTQILGYIIFTFKKVQENNWIKNDIIIQEFIYENRDVLNELISFLHTQSDQINRIIYSTQDEYFHFILNDPRDGTDNILVPLAHQSNTQGIGIMYRVINMKRLFRTMKKRNFNDQTCRIKINIKDSFLARNDGSVILHFYNGRLKGEGKRDYEVEIWVDVGDFSSLIIGAVDFRSLHEYSLADISSTRYVNLINSLFLVAQKPMSTTQF